ncbi:MAG: hypothetical protein FWF07_01880 [Methanomassiliicoccaceae archaeon]|nr:hypothetical protein [Methanomassiliicoccaceae archaeon]
MKLNRKGEIGFPEAIMAAMIVTLVLTMYLGLFAFNAAEDSGGPEVHIDHRIFKDLTLENGEIAGDIELRLAEEMERHGFRGVSVICEIPGDLGFPDRNIVIGNMDGLISGERFVFLLGASDGRIVPAVIEVAVCA